MSEALSMSSASRGTRTKAPTGCAPSSASSPRTRPPGAEQSAVSRTGRQGPVIDEAPRGFATVPRCLRP